jgi:hypothetical protein
VAPHNWVRDLAADVDPPTDTVRGDLRFTLERDHEEIKTFDGNAWQQLYSSDQVKAWIAALNLFEGTTAETGHPVGGAVQFNALPDLTSADPLVLAENAALAAHYFTFVGTPGYVIKPTDEAGVGADLPGVILNPGDWLQVVNRGTPTAPDMHWVSIGGDLLAKSRADNLYGLKAWTPGSWEKDSLVTLHGDVYRALRGVVAADGPPDVIPTPPATSAWELVDISGGLKIAQTDPGGGPGALPTTAPAGQVWIVLQSAAAGGKQALYAYDNAANRWEELGGGGVPLDLTGGVVIYPKNLVTTADYQQPLDYENNRPMSKPQQMGDLLVRYIQTQRPTIVGIAGNDTNYFWRQDDFIFTAESQVTTELPKLAAFPGQKMLLFSGGRAEIVAVADAGRKWVSTRRPSDVLLWNRSNMPDGFANWSGGDMALQRAAKPGHLLRLDVTFIHTSDMNYGTQKVLYALRDAAGADVVADWWQCSDSHNDEGYVTGNVAGGFWTMIPVPTNKNPATKLNLATQRIYHNGTSTTCRIQFALTDMGLY